MAACTAVGAAVRVEEVARSTGRVEPPVETRQPPPVEVAEVVATLVRGARGDALCRRAEVRAGDAAGRELAPCGKGCGALVATAADEDRAVHRRLDGDLLPCAVAVLQLAPDEAAALRHHDGEPVIAQDGAGGELRGDPAVHGTRRERRRARQDRGAGPGRGERSPSPEGAHGNHGWDGAVDSGATRMGGQGSGRTTPAGRPSRFPATACLLTAGTSRWGMTTEGTEPTTVRRFTGHWPPAGCAGALRFPWKRPTRARCGRRLFGWCLVRVPVGGAEFDPSVTMMQVPQPDLHRPTTLTIRLGTAPCRRGRSARRWMTRRPRPRTVRREHRRKTDDRTWTG